MRWCSIILVACLAVALPTWAAEDECAKIENEQERVDCIAARAQNTLDDARRLLDDYSVNRCAQRVTETALLEVIRMARLHDPETLAEVQRDPAGVTQRVKVAFVDASQLLAEILYGLYHYEDKAARKKVLVICVRELGDSPFD